MFCSSVFQSPPILLVVGGPNSPAQEEQPTEFHVHQDLLTQASPFFSTMFCNSCNTEPANPSPWLEAKAKRVILPEDRAEDWMRMIHWLYTDGFVGHTLRQHHLENKSRRQLFSIIQSRQPGLIDNSMTASINEYLTWKDQSSISKPYRGLSDEELSKTLEKCLSKAGIRRHITGEDLLLIRALRIEKRQAKGEYSKRPNPPMFGPLIRLAILADKYGIGLIGPFGLQQQIALRIDCVSRIVNAVPDQEDVQRLWLEIPGSNHHVKHIIAGCYARLSGSNYERLVGRHKDEEILSLEDDNMDHQFGGVGWPLNFLEAVAHRSS